MERALREGREGADRLDLVAEELDAQRLAAGRREDVDDPAAHRELTTVVDALAARVAGEGERLRQTLDAELAAGGELERRRPRRTRRQPLGDGVGGRADESAARQDVEGAGPLADEVRRRLEARLPPHAAARQVADALLADEPAGSLGRVARIGVLRELADECVQYRAVHDERRNRRVPRP